jgi:hypothetical protein
VIIAGIDYSLTSPCICLFNGLLHGEFCYKNCSFYFLTDIKKNATMFNNNIRGELFPDYTAECGRYDSISDWAVDLLIGCNMVALEDYAYGAKGRVFHIAENTGILKYKLWQNSIPLDVVQPTKVKKFATGKGNAGKPEMFQAFVEETGVDLRFHMNDTKKEIGNPISDIVDSYYICKYNYKEIN